MPFSDEELRERLLLGEDGDWEFKQFEFAGDRPKSPKQSGLADELAAFANGSGGTLLCGVTDAGKVQSLTRGQLDAVADLLVAACRDSIKPPIRAGISRRTLDGRTLVIAEVEAGDSQHDSPGGAAYIRIGPSKRTMTSGERLRLATRRAQAGNFGVDRWPVSDTGFGSLDESLWNNLLDVNSAAEPERSLLKMGLLRYDAYGVRRATVAGVLMCSRRPEEWLSNARITAVRYRGEDRSTQQLDAWEITGALPTQVANAMAFVRRNMLTAARKDPARVDVPQYSLKAVFEAVVNAVAHRDYSIRGSAIRLSMFRDRLEIDSPGSLPNGVTVDNMDSQQSTRNDVLVSALRRSPVGEVSGMGDRVFLVEERGAGVPIIMAETHATSGRLPQYELIEGWNLVLRIPAASLEPTPAQPIVTVYSDGAPLAGVDVVAIFPNKTWKRASTDEHGAAQLSLHSTHLPMTVFAAAPGYEAGHIRVWTPAKEALTLDLVSLSDGGSAIFPEATGHLPGLLGRLNPIRDTSNRTYIYASNISINDGRQQPVGFRFGETMQLLDSEGNGLDLLVVDIVGRSALVQYRFAGAGTGA